MTTFKNTKEFFQQILRPCSLLFGHFVHNHQDQESIRYQILPYHCVTIPSIYNIELNLNRIFAQVAFVLAYISNTEHVLKCTLASEHF